MGISWKCAVQIADKKAELEGQIANKKEDIKAIKASLVLPRCRPLSSALRGARLLRPHIPAAYPAP